MKLIKIIPLILLLALVRFTSANIVTIQVGGFSFTPQTADVTVGDTISWTWTSGTHTTTSVTIPAGAAAWNVSMDNLHPTFIYVVTIPGTYNYQCNIHVAMGMTGVITVNPIGIKPISSNVPEKFTLFQNYPNPFNPSTNIRFDLPVRADVHLRIYDITGKNVATLVNEKLQAGMYSVDWNASNYASGVYFYQIETPEFNVTKKLALIK